MKHCFTVYIVVPHDVEHSTVCGCARLVEQVVKQILKSGKNPPPMLYWDGQGRKANTKYGKNPSPSTKKGKKLF